MKARNCHFTCTSLISLWTIITSRRFACKCYFQHPAARVRVTECTNMCETPFGCPVWSYRTIMRSHTRRRARRHVHRHTPIIRTTWIHPASVFCHRIISTLFCTTSRHDIQTSWILSKNLFHTAWKKPAFLHHPFLQALILTI